MSIYVCPGKVGREKQPYVTGHDVRWVPHGFVLAVVI